MLGSIQDLWRIACSPQQSLRQELHEPAEIGSTLIHWVIPWSAIKSVAVAIALAPGVNGLQATLLVLSPWAINVALFAVCTTILPWLSERIDVGISAEQAAVLSAITLAPTYVLGLLFIFGEHHPWIFLWSRFAFLLASALSGLWLLQQGLKYCGARDAKRRMWLSASTVAALMALQGVLLAMRALALWILVLVLAWLSV